MEDRSPQEIVKVIVKRLAMARQKKGLSYEQLADMTGLHRTGISLIERGERQPSLLNIIKIAQALELDLSQLLKS